MAIDFTLTAEQKALQSTAREFAQEILKPLVARADAAPNPQKAFQIVKPAYIEAYKLGFAMAPIPREYGGGGLSNVDLQVVTEEICAVDPGFACTLLGNGMALMPLAWLGSKEQKKKWLGEATNDHCRARPGQRRVRAERPQVLAVERGRLGFQGRQREHGNRADGQG